VEHRDLCCGFQDGDQDKVAYNDNSWIGTGAVSAEPVYRGLNTEDACSTSPSESGECRVLLTQ
jgi:hypothetical protein